MEAESILTGSFIIDPSLRFCKIVRALNMTTKSNMSELAEASKLAAVLALLKRSETLHSTFILDDKFLGLSKDGRRSTDHLW